VLDAASGAAETGSGEGVSSGTVAGGGGGAASVFLEKSHMLRVASGACTHVGAHGNERLTRWGMYVLSHCPSEVVRVMISLPATAVVSRQTRYSSASSTYVRHDGFISPKFDPEKFVTHLAPMHLSLDNMAGDL